MTCEKCGWDLRVGDWPFCGTGRDHRPAVANVIGDDIPGGQVIETLDHEPQTFYSKKAIAEAADARGLRIRDQWAGEHDQHLTNWAAGIDAQTLANAAALLSRPKVGRHEPSVGLETFKGEIREVTLS